jgi:hypothetical protein
LFLWSLLLSNLGTYIVVHSLSNAKFLAKKYKSV